MDFKLFVFYFFSVLIVLAASRVITVRDPVHAALYLVLGFFSASGIWILLGAEFLAIALIVIYVGAVMVLFLFVVMLLDINLDRLRENFWSYLPLGAVIALLIVFEMALVIIGMYAGVLENDVPDVTAGYSNVKSLGRLLFTEYVYPFELASVVLLVGIVSATALTLRGKRKSKLVDPSQQVFVQPKERIHLVEVKSDSE